MDKLDTIKNLGEKIKEVFSLKINPNKIEEIEVYREKISTYWRKIDYSLNTGNKISLPNSLEWIKLQKIQNLFDATGVNTAFPIYIEKIPEAYDYDPIAKNNWLYATFKGFQNLKTRLQKENKSCKNFATIGTGPGIDAIGAYYILQPNTIWLTDINEWVLDIARQNLHNNLPRNVCYTSQRQGNLLEPFNNIKNLRTKEPYKLDVIYANLPNIPAQNIKLKNTIQSSSYVQKNLITGCSDEIDRYLLAHQYKFLCDAKKHLQPGGSSIIALGGRIPFEKIDQLFEEAGLELEELFHMIKIQTQPEEVITGYALNEKINKAQFTFYDHDDIKNLGYEDYESSSGGKDLQKILEPYAISAQEALKRHKNKHQIAHLVYILRGVNN